MNATTVRPEIELGPIRPPQRLAPFSYALGAEVRHPETAIVPERSEGDAFGRLILLHDPEGAEAWDGTMRLVAYIQADLDSSEAVDPLLPEVAWSWLVEALESRRRARHRARRHRHRHHVGALRRHLRAAARPPAGAARVLDGDDAGARPARAGVLRGARARRGPSAGRGHRPELPHARLTMADPEEAGRAETRAGGRRRCWHRADGVPAAVGHAGRNRQGRRAFGVRPRAVRGRCRAGVGLPLLQPRLSGADPPRRCGHRADRPGQPRRRPAGDAGAGRRGAGHRRVGAARRRPGPAVPGRDRHAGRRSCTTPNWPAGWPA